MKSFLNLKQRDDEDSIDYLEHYKAARDVFISHAGKVFCFPKLLEDAEGYKDHIAKITDPNSTADEKKDTEKAIEAIRKDSMDEFLGYLYLENSDKSRYGSLLKGMDAHYIKRKDPKEEH